MSVTDIPLVRNSERNDFKRCPWLWHESWVKGKTTRRTPTWAWFGTAIHRALEVRYPIGIKRGARADVLIAFEDAINGEVRRVYTEGGEIEDDEVVDGKELGLEMLRGYMDHYGDDSEWEVIHSEQSFQIDVPHPTKDKIMAVQAGTWDLLGRNRITKDFWLWDHKTRKTFPSNWAVYNINDQAGTYLWVAPEVLKHMGIFSKHDKIEGLVFNTLRKHLPDTRPLNAAGRATNKPKKEHYLEALRARDIFIPKKALVRDLEEICAENHITVLGDESVVQPSPLFHREQIFRSQGERVKQAQRVQAEVIAMNAMRAGKLKIWKTPTEDCIRCQLFEYCEADEQDYEEGQELGQSILRNRDPYADHREAMSKGGVIL